MSQRRVLICDDDDRLRRSVVRLLRSDGLHVEEAASGRDALDRVRLEPPDALLLDLGLPDEDGLRILRTLRREGYEGAVLILTGQGDVSSAVKATRLGASEFLMKPFEPKRLLESLRRETGHRNPGAPESHSALRTYAELQAASPAMHHVFDQLSRLRELDFSTVLLHGESGTGKELVARALHHEGCRRARPFVEVDCSTIPDALFESTLFGHERGAFTGANQRQLGLFGSAEDGIVFLDEVGELPEGVQSKLLRALESRTFRRVGGTETLPLRASVVAATHRDLRLEVEKGRFRQDLYYRLAVIPLSIPPLRERKEDILALARVFLASFAGQFERPVLTISAPAAKHLLDYCWPGNVRELKNTMERLSVFVDGEQILPEHLPPAVRYASPPDDLDRFVLPEGGVRLEDVEAHLVRQAMDRCGGNQSAAAKLLGLSRYQLRHRLKKLGLL
ncbi:MAG: sigma-54-dependent Fis family transcriptional regulator [Deltaproteobacteria bacterium]|nr:MAG: sigma-54-dependent Fis family transcriptional regulator [Deltaproteobacteria bacterium]